jgi:hypothetical protein
MPRIRLLEMPKRIINACILPAPKNLLHMTCDIANFIDGVSYSGIALTNLFVDFEKDIV